MTAHLVTTVLQSASETNGAPQSLPPFYPSLISAAALIHQYLGTLCGMNITFIIMGPGPYQNVIIHLSLCVCIMENTES